MKAWRQIVGGFVRTLSVISLTVGALGSVSAVALATGDTVGVDTRYPAPPLDEGEFARSRNAAAGERISVGPSKPFDGSDTALFSFRASEHQPLSGTLVVTSTADSGAGTLRQVLWDATNGDTITFDQTVFPPSSPATIALANPLPCITQGNLTIDASNAGVILDGSASDHGNGIDIVSNGNVIKGLQILNSPWHGIRIHSGASNNLIGGTNTSPNGACSGDCNLISGSGQIGVVVQGGGTFSNTVSGNYIGTDVNGATAIGNANQGIYIGGGASYNVVGGDTAGERNLVSGNGEDGMLIEDSGTVSNTISGNYIGTDVSGTTVISNTNHGIYIRNDTSYNVVGGDTAGERNIISGNGEDGVRIENGGAMSNTVSGNYIGTDVSGVAAIGNTGAGVSINETSHNVIGGHAEGEHNIISGNGRWGILLTGPDATNNVICGNFVGVDVSGSVALSNDEDGIRLDNGAQYNVIGGVTEGERNLISGNGYKGVFMDGASHNAVIGNYIGTDSTGMAPIGNGSSGVEIFNGSHHNRVGGTTSGERNVISGNATYGVVFNGEFDGAHDNSVVGNYIGTDATGTGPLGNASHGVGMWNGASNNTVGGDTPGERNVISGNGGSGVSINGSGTMSNTVSGNYIGVDVNGTNALPNQSEGIFISGSSHNTIGGDTEAKRNIISGNSDGGVLICGSDSSNNTVRGNFIGTDVAGTSRLPNGASGKGVFVFDGAADNIIGGSSPNEGNLISGNDYAGVEINGIGTTGNVVQGNYIGTDVTGSVALGNREKGVFVFNSAQHNTVGGSNPGARNIISGNDGSGIVLESAGTDNNEIMGNYIGTDATGMLAVPNSSDGIVISDGASHNVIGGGSATPGGACTGDCNVVSGNGRDGVTIGGSNTMSNTVSGNYIGTDVSGAMAVSNHFGVALGEGTQFNVIGGSTAAQRNIISGNAERGVSVDGANVMSNTVSGNYIGLSTSGTVAVPNGTEGVIIINGASHNTIGGSNSSQANVVSGNSWTGVRIEGGGTMHNTVSGNYIGLSPSGTAAIPNGLNGVDIIDGATHNLIGGDTATERNLISGNDGNGVSISGSSTMSNTVSGNYIGIDADGMVVLSNENGVSIAGGAQRNRIGGATVGERNVIGGNQGSDVSIWDTGTDHNVVSGNFIGINASGTEALRTSPTYYAYGVHVFGGAQYNVVGGDTPGERNVIGGTDFGVQIDGSDTAHNVVTGNFIGTDVSGTAAVGNFFGGVLFHLGTHGNRVGGSVPGEGNLISGNDEGIGFQTGSYDNVVIGNLIGTDASGTIGLGNQTDGIAMRWDACRNHVGGLDPGESNTIAYNGSHGIHIYGDTVVANTITRNSIHDNDGLGIELRDGGNTELAAPVIAGFDLSGGVVTGTACANCTVEVFSDDAEEGRAYEGTTTAGSGGDFTFAKGSSLAGPRVTATATDGEGNTSEFSTRPPTTCTVTSTAGSGPGTLRVCLEDAVSGDRIEFDTAVFPPGAPATITLASGLPDLDDGNVTLDASNAGVILDGSGIGTTPETVLLDDASLTLDGGPDLISNGDFTAGLGHWRPWDDGPGATRSLNTGDFHSSPASYDWDVVAHAGASRTVYDTTDTSDPFDDWPYDEDSTVWIGATGGSVAEVRFWYRYGEGRVGLRALFSDGHEEWLGDEWFDWEADWTEAVISRTLPGDAVGVAVEFEYSHLERWTAGLRVNSSDNTIRGLQILGFPGDGIRVEDGARHNRIGGDRGVGAGPLGQGNLVSANGDNGVYIGDPETAYNTVAGNYIGVDATGARALGNRQHGVRLWFATHHNDIVDNVISGNGGAGVEALNDDVGNVIRDNVIGLDATGTLAVGNGWVGIYLGEGDWDAKAPRLTQILDNVISGNGGSGIEIRSGGAVSNTVSGNTIGTDVSGTAALPNDDRGVYIVDGASYNVIGGDAPGERNLISGNGRHGVHIEHAGTDNNIVIGNYIGTDVSGAAALPNGENGIEIDDGANYNVIGGDAPGERNLISGNSGHGVMLGDYVMYNIISGNYVGTNISGTAAIENTGNGVYVSNAASYNLVGGVNGTPGGACSGECNVISGNDGDGVRIEGKWGDLEVFPDLAGLTPDYAGTFPVISFPPTDGAFASTDGITPTTASGDPFYDVFAARFTGLLHISVSGEYTFTLGSDDGSLLYIDGDLVVDRNYLTAYSTSQATRNLTAGSHPIVIDFFENYGAAGLALDSSGPATVILTTDGSTPGLTGEFFQFEGTLYPTSYNTVSGNYIGTDVSGSYAISNTGEGGIRMGDGAQYNVVGGDTAAERNVISGNGGHGVAIVGNGTLSNVVSGNYIGTDATGVTALPNGVSTGDPWELPYQGDGVFVCCGASYNLVGGHGTGEGNVVSGNVRHGVLVWNEGADYNQIVGNLVGTDATGGSIVANDWFGVGVYSGPKHTMVEGNVISGNRWGVGIGNDLAGDPPAYTRIEGNYIGTDATSTMPLGNTREGIAIADGASDTIVGGAAVAARNVIAHNGRDGVTVRDPDSLRNTITRNSIHDNGGMGIDLYDGGNAELAAPVITGFDLAAGTVTGVACANCTIEVFSDGSDEGEVYEGQTVANGTGDWAFSKGSSLTGPHLTATATDAAGNTSEFSDPAPPINTPPVFSDLPDQLFDHTTSPPSVIDLWSYVSDAESDPDDLTYTIEGTPPAGAGVTLASNQYVIVDPSPNWCGGTDVTVRATDPGGLWGEDAFRVAVSWSCPGPVSMPGAPVLVAPVDGRTAHSGAPTFAWHPVGGAEVYQIQVDDADKGHPADVSSPERDEITRSTDHIPASALDGGTYTWRVRAVNGSEVGAWSEGWAFSVPGPALSQHEMYLPVVARNRR